MWNQSQIVYLLEPTFAAKNKEYKYMPVKGLDVGIKNDVQSSS